MILALTGATGFVGQAVVEEAERRGIALRALTRREQPERNGIHWVSGDLQDDAALADLVRGADAVMHVAGVVNTPDPAGFHIGNVEGTQRLITATREAGARRFLFVSSLSAREPGLSAYGRSKRHAEAELQLSGLDWTIVRPPAIYGPRDREMLDLFRAARWGVVPMPPEGHASLIHVDDLARLLLTLADGVMADATIGRTYEPDDGRTDGWSHGDMARAIGAAVGRRVWVPHLSKGMLDAAAWLDKALRGDKAKLTPDRIGYMVHPDWVCRPQAAVPQAVWQPQVETRLGLHSTADWYRDNGWL